MKNPVNDTFSMKDGAATWKNQAEYGHQANATGRYFVALNGGPTSFVLLVKALLMNGTSCRCHLGVSGHVPSGMIAEQFVRDGLTKSNT